MSAHIVVSHGADFYGEDRHTLKGLRDLAEPAWCALLRVDSGPLLGLLRSPADGTFPPATARQLSEHLLRVARDPHVKSRPAALARALADAAARAAGDDEPWIWRLEP
jgi:hypothetical protein